MRLAVDGGGYGSAAKALRGGNELAALHHGTLTQEPPGSRGWRETTTRRRSSPSSTTPRPRRSSTGSTTWSTRSRPCAA